MNTTAKVERCSNYNVPGWVHPWVQNKTQPLFRMLVCTRQRSLPFYYAPTCTQFSGCRLLLHFVSKLEYDAILEKSEPDPDWEWVRISLFPLKYRGVIDF